MSEDQPIEFTRNYTDHSTEQGFQYEFFCDRCGNGKRTPFKPFSLNKVSGVLDAASSLFGGVFSSAADVGGRVSSAAYERAKDQAFQEAVQSLRPSFIQCPR